MITDLNDSRSIYLKRYIIFETPWGGLYLHGIYRPDNDRHLHNHPWPFVSVILRGGYIEEGALDAYKAPTVDNATLQLYRRFNINRKKLNEYHVIRLLNHTPTWTLMFIGRRAQDWGYATQEGFIPADTYHKYVEYLR